MDSRRKFVGTVAYGLAGTLAAGTVSASPNSRLRFGIIGAGDRGTQLANHIRACANTEIIAVADAVAARTAAFPDTRAHRDYRALLDDAQIDAVVIATPQHLHAAQFCDAIAAGKHVYVEKTAALTVEQAIRMRRAYRADGSRRVVQVGHQATSSGHMADLRRFLADPAYVGDVTAINLQMYRNTPRNKPQWARPALLNADLTPNAVDWQGFLGDTAPTKFDPHRLIHWRYFWDYSGGSAFENMSQQLAFWYKALDLQIPNSATMSGGIYLWNDGREVPDTVSINLQQREGMLVSWNSGFGNNELGMSDALLGTNGSILRASQIRYVPQKVNRPDLKEALGRSAHTPHSHMEDFINTIRSGGEPACPLEVGLRVSIACRMAVESYLRGATVRWDAEREQII